MARMKNQQHSYIHIENVTKRYPNSKVLALDGINLGILQGEFFGLLGPNGSGKTTLISILCGLLHATTGTVKLGGYESPKQLSAIRPLIGLVPQELALYSTMSLKENLIFFGRLYGLHGKLLHERVDKCLETARLQHVANKQVGKFSGGMKRRANLVLGLIHQPLIIFLDEPTVNVDPQSREVIFDILLELNKNGSTMIYTTHYLEEAEELCQRVAIVDEGKVVKVDSPQNLINSYPGCHDLGEVFLQLTGRHLRD